MDDKFQKIVVTGILVIEGKVLLLRRSKNEDFMPGKYECPGGKVDFGENPRDSLKREYIEETGLEIEVLAPVDVIHYTSQNGQRHTVEIFFKVNLANPRSFEIKLSDAHDDYMLASFDELDKLDTQKIDPILNIVREVLN